MDLLNLIGLRIKDIKYNYIYENEYGMQEFYSYIKLSNGLIFMIPYYPDEEVVENKALKEVFKKAKKVNIDFLKKLKDKHIVNFHFPYFENELNEGRKSYVELEGSIFLTEMNSGPPGITNVDMHLYTRLEFENEKGNLEDGFQIIPLTDIIRNKKQKCSNNEMK